MEEFIPLLIFAILSAAGSWLQNRREKKGETAWDEVEGEAPESKPVDSESQAPPAEPKTVQETLRETLGIPGAEEVKREKDRSEPPVIPPTPRPAPPRSGRVEPPSRPSHKRATRKSPTTRATRKSPKTRDPISREKSPAQELKKAREASIESKEAELEAARAKQKAARRERDIAIEKSRATRRSETEAPRLSDGEIGQTGPTGTVGEIGHVSPRSIQKILRHPESAKTAFAASVVFGPPKGLE